MANAAAEEESLDFDSFIFDLEGSPPGNEDDGQGSPLLRPIIRQLLTASNLDEGVVLLVDKVNIASFDRDGERRETCRLWLSDGEISIQCLLRQDIHHLLTSGDIRQGTLISLDKYRVLQQPRLNGSGSVCVLLASQLHVIASDDRGSPEYDVEHWGVPQSSQGVFFKEYGKAAAPEINERLPAQDKLQEGHAPTSKLHEDPAAAKPPGEPTNEPDNESVDLIPTPKKTAASTESPTSASKRKANDVSGSQPLSQLDPNKSKYLGRPSKRTRLLESDNVKSADDQSTESLEVLKALQSTPQKKRIGEDKPDSSPKQDDFISTKQTPDSLRQGSVKNFFWKSPSSSPNKITSRQTSPSQSTLSFTPTPKKDLKREPEVGEVTPSPLRRQLPPTKAPRQQVSKPPAAVAASSSSSAVAASSSSSSLKPITRPLKITALANVTGRWASRNKVFDFLAIVSHVNPRLLVRKGFPESRELLILDRSMAKQVHLTVFVDAKTFLPEQGTVALLRNITTHEYGGGSLKAYHGRCAGTHWYQPETPGWQWADESDRLRAFWLDNPQARDIPPGTWWTDRGLARLQPSTTTTTTKTTKTMKKK